MGIFCYYFDVFNLFNLSIDEFIYFIVYIFLIFNINEKVFLWGLIGYDVLNYFWWVFKRENIDDIM